MNENRFAPAAWASICGAVLLPLAFIVAGIEGMAYDLSEVEHFGWIGLADFLFLILGAVFIYIFLSLKRALYERYSYRGLNFVISVAILWTIVNYGGSFVLELFLLMAPPSSMDIQVVIGTVFWIVCIAGFGVIDIIVGLMLLRQGRRFSVPLRIFAVLSLVSGFFEATVILSFFALLFYPAALIALAFAFLKPDREIEFI